MHCGSRVPHMEISSWPPPPDPVSGRKAPTPRGEATGITSFLLTDLSVSKPAQVSPSLVGENKQKPELSLMNGQQFISSLGLVSKMESLREKKRKEKNKFRETLFSSLQDRTLFTSLGTKQCLKQT